MEVPNHRISKRTGPERCNLCGCLLPDPPNKCQKCYDRLHKKVVDAMKPDLNAEPITYGLIDRQGGSVVGVINSTKGVAYA